MIDENPGKPSAIAIAAWSVHPATRPAMRTAWRAKTHHAKKNSMAKVPHVMASTAGPCDKTNPTAGFMYSGTLNGGNIIQYQTAEPSRHSRKIGRASCRERERSVTGDA